MKASTKMQKGFTLIELMVVIVIIGILSAVALPKMFGMSAKAKASEVMPASVQYERLQTAYFQETNDVAAMGTIGYDAPTDGNFAYTETATSTSDQSLVITSQAEYNNCPNGSTWTTQVLTTSGLQSSRAIVGAGCDVITSSKYPKLLADI
jgi:type IV pilus assembly protein PilA